MSEAIDTPNPMLVELRVENLLLLEGAELAFAPGLNVLTGETGAGKTLLAHALDLLLGGRARSGIVRQGAAEAYVEGTFDLPSATDAGELIPADASELVLARRVWADGRTRAYVCGRSATIADLRDLAGRLLAFYGQHEHHKLTLSTAPLELLDARCGPAQLALRARFAEAHHRMRELQQRTEELRALAGARERELDLLEFELREIEALAPSVAEEQELNGELRRLRHLETLRGAAAAGAELLAGEGGAGVAEALAQAESQMGPAAAIDTGLRGLHDRLAALRYEAEDVAGELRRYLLGLEGSPGRLEDVEERLGHYQRLARKHGGSIADVLAHAQRCRTRREELQSADAALDAVQARLTPTREEVSDLARQLSERRRRIAPKLAAAVQGRLAELAMPGARFEVQVRPREEGPGPRGADAVELLVAPNAGLPCAPVREIASGGELSRVMLALLSVAHETRAGAQKRDRGRSRGASDRGRMSGRGGMSDRGRSRPSSEPADEPLLVFDEIDAGIGGHTARAVGEHLRALARGRQVLCITHLPQVASLADRHFTIAKDATALPARTTVRTLAGDAVVAELVRMLGAREDDEAASRHALALLEAA